ncbi:MAG: hypothetical protein CL868_21515 [Cytophagaceae bacterium]|nr:hypothetical protein [Cytophagaceae bacterium]
MSLYNHNNIIFLIMKQNFFTSMFLFLCSLLSAQTYHTVDNAPGSVADFTEVKDAITAAADGDVILVQGSSETYVNFDVTKRLTIIGPGYFLGQNDAPFSQANKVSATVSQFRVQTGGSGSIISGFTVRNPSASGASNVIFRNLYVPTGGAYFNATNSTNITVEKCYLMNSFKTQKSSVVYRQNIVVITGRLFSFGIDEGTISLENNTIIKANDNALFIDENHESQFSTLYGNIIYANDFDFEEPTSNVMDHNLFITDEADAAAIAVMQSGNNSIIPTSQASQVFVGFPDGAGMSPDEIYKLKTGSPAIDADEDGNNQGAFQEEGGYVLSGIPFIPNIYKLEVSETGTTQDGIKITIGARANADQ